MGTFVYGSVRAICLSVGKAYDKTTQAEAVCIYDKLYSYYHGWIFFA
ncbi:MAG: hypothetical protein PHQ46_01085 [Negativicutes bacterium]|nr:hypothetical protein [Negativicutes bacterium]